MRGVVTVASDALRRRAIDAGLVWDMAASRSSRDHLSLRQSKIKPLCDGTHRGIGFREDGTAADVRRSCRARDQEAVVDRSTVPA